MASGRNHRDYRKVAEFTWEKGNQERVTVRQRETGYCTSFSYSQQGFRWRQWLERAWFQYNSSDLLSFPAELSRSHLGLVSSNLNTNTSPFASLALGQPWLTVHCDQMRLVVSAPSSETERAITFQVSVDTLETDYASR